MEKKIKILTLGDMPLSPSGVGTQSRYVIEALLKTGRYQVVSLGGAIKHQQYQPIKTEDYGDDWLLFPVDSFGNADILRSIIRDQRPDILWFMTDPRFYEWLWMIEDEIRPLMPMVYYHVWDNYPYPKFNKPYYISNDLVVAISKLTDNCVKNVAPEVESIYLPHAVDTNIFKFYGKEARRKMKKENLGPDYENKFVFLWNNRNARRKMSGSVIWWFKEFLDEIGHDKAILIMHTDPNDHNGPNLEAIINELGLIDGEVQFSKEKLPMGSLAGMYNLADCVINISDAEGFGLSTLEALACEKPIIVTMTGGLQEQVTDGKTWFGVGLEPAHRGVIGSQNVPFIYEDRVCKKDFIDALHKIYSMSEEERFELGRKGRQHVIRNYNFETFCHSWVDLLDDVYERHGSWNNRKLYKSWTLQEVA